MESMYTITGLYSEPAEGISTAAATAARSFELKKHKRALSNGIHETNSHNYKLNSLDVKRHVRSSSSGYQEVLRHRKPSTGTSPIPHFPPSSKRHVRSSSSGFQPTSPGEAQKGHSRGISFSDYSIKTLQRNGSFTDFLRGHARSGSHASNDYVIRCHSRNPSGVGVFIPVEKIEPVPCEEVLLTECGILSCRPSFIQQLANIKVFVFLLSFLVTLQQALSSGYINSVITTIEKRFEIPSSLSGLVASSYEIGNVITVIFVSYLGSTRHIPVWIGVGSVIMGIGSMLFVVPHFTSDTPIALVHSNLTNDNICRAPILHHRDMDLGRLANGLSRIHDNCIKSPPSTWGPVLMFVLAQLLLGCGGSPLFTLGTTYVDDHVPADSASLYIGCMYSMAAFGPVCGFLLGAYLLNFHMDSFSSLPHSLGPEDPRWIGLWWGGFLLCGVLLIVVAIPFFSFPKVLTRDKEKIRLMEKAKQEAEGAKKKEGAEPGRGPEGAEPSGRGYGKDIKDIPRSMLRLVCNPVYVVTCLGACMELIIVSGFVVFLPKYLETQFSMGKSQASVLTGSVAIPGACIGIFMGGCLLKRLELKPKGAVQFVIISNLICVACYALLFFLGCDNLKMAGTTIPYTNNSSVEPFRVNLTAACNFGCDCGTSDVEPVCGNNGLTYFSPCHAGCTAFSSRNNYTNCACVHENVSGGEFAEVTVVPVATAGPCVSSCRTIYPFLILLFIMTFVVATCQMPLLMIVLRSVGEEERSFALGMQFVIFRLFGYIPAPILFGNLIDSTCILWKSTCGERGGRCLLYDIEQFRYRYVGLCGGIKLVALALFIVDWWLVRRQLQTPDPAPPLSLNDVVGSIVSIDKLFDERVKSRPVSRATSNVSEKPNTLGSTNTSSNLNIQQGNLNLALEEENTITSHSHVIS